MSEDDVRVRIIIDRAPHRARSWFGDPLTVDNAYSLLTYIVADPLRPYELFSMYTGHIRSSGFARPRNTGKTERDNNRRGFRGMRGPPRVTNPDIVDSPGRSVGSVLPLFFNLFSHRMNWLNEDIADVDVPDERVNAC